MSRSRETRNETTARNVNAGKIYISHGENGRAIGSGIQEDDYTDGSKSDINATIRGANRGEASVAGCYHKWSRYGNVRFENDGKYAELCGPVRIVQEGRKKK